jgi:hypothetical protein
VSSYELESDAYSIEYRQQLMLKAATVKNAVFQHPFTGSPTPGQALHTARLHLAAHIRHIKQNLRLAIE